MALEDPVLKETIRRMKEILDKTRYVKTGDIVKPEDHNLLVDFAVESLEFAARIAVSGLLPPWVPILDVGKTDYMIVGEPRRPIMGAPPLYQYLEKKPIYGYLYETDVLTVVRELNKLLNEERLPDLKFGDILTSDTWNSWWDIIDELAHRAGLPYRLGAVGADVFRPEPMKISVQTATSQIRISTMNIEVSVRVE